MYNLIRHVIVKNNVVINCVEYETEQTGCPDGFEDVTAYASDTAQIGWTYVNGEFINPTPIPEPLPIEIPTVITMRQARMCLIMNGLFDQINTAISQLTGVDGDLAKTEWEYSMTLARDNPLVQRITTELNLTDEQLDALFLQASGL